MPSVLYYGKGHSDWWQQFPKTSNNFYGWYLLPPVLYPDGKSCMVADLDHLDAKNTTFISRTFVYI